jgi:hypothetical protein
MAAVVWITGLWALGMCAPAGADVFGPISLVSGDALEQANYAHDPAISADGTYVVFDGFFDGRTGVWRRNLQTGAIQPVAAGEPESPSGDAELPSISANGQFVSFTTTAALASQNDRNIGPDVYVRNMNVPETQQGSQCEEGALHPSPERLCAFTLASAVNGSTHGLTYQYPSGAAKENAEEEYGALASGRSALSANGQEVVFATTAPSNLAGPGTPQLEVAVRYLETGETELVSVEYDPATGRSLAGVPVPLQTAARGGSEAYGALYSDGTGLPFKMPQPYEVTAQVPVSISANGSTVAWLAQVVGEQAAMLPDETLKPEYSELLWRRIADGEEAPTRRVTGGSDPTYPACVASGETALPAQASSSDPCQGPFSTETSPDGLWNGGEGDAVPRLSEDGETVAFIASAPLVSLGNDFGVEAATRHSDLYIANMREGLSRVQALTPLTELASGEEGQIATNGQIMDFGISADGGQVAFTTMRTVFPLGSPTFVSAPAAVPGMVELFDVDLADDTLTRVTRGYEGGPSEHPHEIVDKEDQYEAHGDGAQAPSFSGNGDTLAFSSTASNLVYGDGNTPPVGSAALDGSDAFVVQRIVYPPEPAPQLISPAPASPSLAPLWNLGVTALSLSDGSVRLYAELPGAGTLRALASSEVAVRRSVSRSPSARKGRTARARSNTTVLARTVASITQNDGASVAGLKTVLLTLSPSYRSLAVRPRGLSATVSVLFVAAGHPTQRVSLTVAFLRKVTAHRVHGAHASAGRKTGRRGR